jgi:hypothetical protein
MDKNQRIILAAGGLITLGLFFVEPIFALIGLVCVLALLMCIRIMGETGNFPLVTVDLAEDAREIIVTNTGTARAQNVHIVIVPMNLDFEVASLEPEEESGFSLGTMISEAKAVVTYEDASGGKRTRSYPLSALSAGRDPTQPLFPIFGSR